MTTVLFLCAGAVLLLKGADMLVDGGSGIALKAGISQLVVGLTIVSFGTSAPELATSLIAAVKGSGDICFGNVVGSNVINIALILGSSALLRPIPVNRLLIGRDIPFMIAITVVTFALGYFGFVGRLAGIGFLVLFVIYLFLCFKTPPAEIEVEDTSRQKRYGTLILLIVLGIAALGAGASLFVDGARNIARSFGVSEAVIGLTIVGIGTSLPELVTSVIAAHKGKADISLGNIVGSNIFNILFVIGISSTLSPFSISPDRYMKFVGLPFMMTVAVLLLPFSISGAILSRREGLFFIAITIIYFTLAFIIS
ncbi:calcium/sodium antiporter [bacterium]|nr:calcium/sodium antiporter [bacterium]